MRSRKGAKKKYSRGAERKIHRVMKEYKRGELHSGRGRGKVKSRKQAVAIAISEARRAGKKVPRRPRARK
jgi:hypothetical protein